MMMIMHVVVMLAMLSLNEVLPLGFFVCDVGDAKKNHRYLIVFPVKLWFL